MVEHTPICDFGWKAPDFKLPGVDGKTYSLDEVRGETGTLIMFICNHCPYVKSVIDRIMRDVSSDELSCVARGDGSDVPPAAADVQNPIGTKSAKRAVYEIRPREKPGTVSLKVTRRARPGEQGIVAVRLVH